MLTNEPAPSTADSSADRPAADSPAGRPTAGSESEAGAEVSREPGAVPGVDAAKEALAKIKETMGQKVQLGVTGGGSAPQAGMRSLVAGDNGGPVGPGGTPAQRDPDLAPRAPPPDMGQGVKTAVPAIARPRSVLGGPAGTSGKPSGSAKRDAPGSTNARAEAAPNPGQGQAQAALAQVPAAGYGARAPAGPMKAGAAPEAAEGADAGGGGGLGGGGGMGAPRVGAATPAVPCEEEDWYGDWINKQLRPETGAHSANRGACNDVGLANDARKHCHESLDAAFNEVPPVSKCTKYEPPECDTYFVRQWRENDYRVTDSHPVNRQACNNVTTQNHARRDCHLRLDSAFGEKPPGGDVCR